MKVALCDGSEVEYEPEYTDDHCDECGHLVGRHVNNKPRFHGETEWRKGKPFCSRCGVEFVGLESATEVLKARLLPSLIELLEKSSPFLAFLKEKK